MSENTAFGMGETTGELYLIGFRSGRELTLKLRDGNQLVSEFVDGMQRNPHANVQWFVGPRLLFNVSEITYVLPVSAVHGSTGGCHGGRSTDV